MKRKYINLTICTLLIIILFEIFDHTKLMINVFIEATKIWFYNLIPTLFPFLIVSDVLSNYGFINYISKIFGKFMKIFKLPKNASYALFMSILSGFPGNSKLIKELLDKKELNKMEANKLLTFTHFSNPLFIIGTIGILYLNNQKLAILILIIHYFTNFIVGLFFRNIYISTTEKEQKKEDKTLPFMSVLIKSINNSINTIFTIFGIIIISSLLVNIITINLNISSFYKSILTSFIEITQGLKLISNEPITLRLKTTLITFFLSFGGISIHMQIISILNEYKINYYIYLLSRIIHACIASILVYIIFNYI